MDRPDPPATLGAGGERSPLDGGDQTHRCRLARDALVSSWVEPGQIGLEVGLGPPPTGPLEGPVAQRLRYRLSASGSLVPTPRGVDVGTELGFLLAFRVVERCGNPIGALVSWLSLLKPGGLLVVAVARRDEAATAEPGSSISDLVVRYLLSQPPHDTGSTVDSAFPAPAAARDRQRTTPSVAGRMHSLDGPTLHAAALLAGHFGGFELTPAEGPGLAANPGDTSTDHVHAYRVAPAGEEATLPDHLGRAVERARHRLRHAARPMAGRIARSVPLAPSLRSGSPEPLNFVIIGHERSGSTLLVDALAGHSRVACFAELFNGSPQRKLFAQAFDGDYYRTGSSPVDFLLRSVYVDRGPAAIGFKVFYHQARSGAASELWPYLVSRSDIKVIHLTRRNLLEVFLSFKLADATKVWSVTVDQATPNTPPPLELDPTETLHYFDRLQAHRRWAEEKFAHHQTLPVDYDELTADFGAVLADVFAFLDVPHETPRKRIRKLPSRPLPDQIANFDQLRSHFRGTIYEDFFEPDP